MAALRNMTGFFGPNLLADITLVVQILFYLVLCAGVVAQLQGKYKWHDRLQIPVVVLNLFFIGFVMVPTFGGVVGTLPGGVSEVPNLVALFHGGLGLLAQGLAIYCLLAGLSILPRKIGRLRYWMWVTFTAWTATIIFGIGVYIVFYTPVLATPSGQPVIEHDADLDLAPVDEAPTEAAETVAEHDEAAVEAAPTEPQPTEAVVAEHDAEPIVAEETEPALAATQAPADESTGEPVSEHAAEIAAPEEPAFTGQIAQVQWRALAPANQGPGIRYGHAMQYNPASNKIFMFGGQDGSQVYNDVWTLDMETLTWQQVAANASPAPPARFSAVMVVDEPGENLYVAVGHTTGGVNFNDIWRLNLATASWEELTVQAGAGPAARYGSPGGNLGGNLVLTHGFGSTRYNDTWRFNLESAQWEDISPAEPRPLNRCLFAAAPSGARLVIHGGCASGFGDCFLDDAWILDTAANNWTQVLSDEQPVGRQYHSLTAAGPESNQVVLFGGQDESRAARNDLWLLDLSSGSWQLTQAENPPDPRYQHAAVWVPNLGMMVYGGRNGEGGLADLWLLSTGQSEPAPAEAATSTPAPTPAPPPTATPELVSEHDGG